MDKVKVSIVCKDLNQINLVVSKVFLQDFQLRLTNGESEFLSIGNVTIAKDQILLVIEEDNA